MFHFAGIADLNSKTHDKDIFLRTLFGLSLCMIMDEKTLVNGVIYLNDFTMFSPKFFTFFGLETIQKTTNIWQVIYGKVFEMNGLH